MTGRTVRVFACTSRRSPGGAGSSWAPSRKSPGARERIPVRNRRTAVAESKSSDSRTRSSHWSVPDGIVYRRQLRPVITTGAVIMDQLSIGT